MILVYRCLGLVTFFFSAALGFTAASGEIQIERTFMPDAGPSAFAIGFPGGVSFCYDPVRGGLNYAWTGGFIDLSSVRPGPGKLIKAVALQGPVVYREQGAAPLRVGDAAHVPVWQFRGYHLGTDNVEFRYTVDGRAVREEIRPLPDGKGLSRHFQIEATAAKAEWWLLPGESAAAAIIAPAGKREGEGWRVSPDAKGEFVVEVHFAKGAK